MVISDCRAHSALLNQVPAWENVIFNPLVPNPVKSVAEDHIFTFPKIHFCTLCDAILPPVFLKVCLAGD